MRRFAGAAVLLIVAAGCDGPADTATTVPELSLEEVARYGSLDGAGTALSSVRDVAPLDSAVLVLEDRPPRVAVFGLDGAWLRDIGRAGEGPGELRCPTRLGTLRDVVWVSDPCGRRLEVFDWDGTPVRSYRWQIQADSTEEPALPGVPLEDGSIVTISTITIHPRPVVRPYYVASAAGDPIARSYLWQQSSRDPFVGRQGESVFFGLHPLPVSPLVDVFDDGRLLVVDELEAGDMEHETFRVRVIAPDGTPELETRVPYRPIPADGWFDRFLTLRGIDASMGEPMLEALDERDFYPPVSAAVAGSDGSMWIRREGVLGDSATWNVLRPTGEIVGTVSTPAGSEILHASLEDVWALERSDLDVPFVVRLRVRPEVD